MRRRPGRRVCSRFIIFVRVRLLHNKTIYNFVRFSQWKQRTSEVNKQTVVEHARSLRVKVRARARYEFFINSFQILNSFSFVAPCAEVATSRADYANFQSPIANEKQPSI